MAVRQRAAARSGAVRRGGGGPDQVRHPARPGSPAAAAAGRLRAGRQPVPERLPERNARLQLLGGPPRPPPRPLGCRVDGDAGGGDGLLRLLLVGSRPAPPRGWPVTLAERPPASFAGRPPAATAAARDAGHRQSLGNGAHADTPGAATTGRRQGSARRDTPGLVAALDDTAPGGSVMAIGRRFGPRDRFAPHVRPVA